MEASNQSFPTVIALELVSPDIRYIPSFPSFYLIDTVVLLLLIAHYPTLIVDIPLLSLLDTKPAGWQEYSGSDDRLHLRMPPLSLVIS